MTGVWTSFLLVLAGGTTLTWLVVRVHEGGVRPVRGLVAFLGRQSKVGRTLLGAFFVALWVIAGTKPDGGSEESRPYTSLQTRVGDADGTNSALMAAAPDGGHRPSDSPEAASDALHAESQNGLHSTADDGRADATPAVSTNAARTLTAEDFARGFVMTRIGTGEAFDFAAPSGATVCADWEAFGAAEDWFYLSFTNWAFRVGTNEVNRFRVFSFGQVDLYANQPYTSLQTRVGTGSDSPAASTGRDVPVAPRLWPFWATLGVVPRANWPRIAGNGNATAEEELAPSRFWHFVTPSNTLLLTWQNVLLGRDTNTPVNVQTELWPSGRFVYRYDLSRLDTGEVTNVLVGASLGGPVWTTNSLPTNVTSMAFHPLSAEDAAAPDRDGDGLPLADEMFVHGTDSYVNGTTTVNILNNVIFV